MRTPETAVLKKSGSHSRSWFWKPSLFTHPPMFLATTGLISWWLYVIVVWLSRGFAYGTPGIERPLIAVMAVFGAVFMLYLAQVTVVMQQQAKKKPDLPEYAGRTMPIIVVFAVAFRGLLLFSEPIQEVDAYRYLWDGNVVTAGVNPFRYSPQQVLDADSSSEMPADLDRLVRIRDQSPSLGEILRRVHYPELTTVYPPVSQAVFAIAAALTPVSASVATHVVILKSFIVMFDLATLWVLVLLLRFVGRPVEHSIIYAWCPLVMKEFANSGHLDSIAVFLTTAAIYCAVRALFPAMQANTPRCDTDMDAAGVTNRLVWQLAMWLLLGLGVGAKIYPAILAPMLFLTIWRRVSFQSASLGAILFAGLSISMVLPMLSRDKHQVESVSDLDVIRQRANVPEETHKAPSTPAFSPQAPRDNSVFADAAREHPPLPPEPQSPVDFASSIDASFSAFSRAASESGPPVPDSDAPDSGIDRTSTGLNAFASQWQMNDFLFLLLFENLTPDRGRDSSRTAWFVVTSAECRNRLVRSVASQTGIAQRRIPFLTARFITTLLFGALALRWGWRAAKSSVSNEWLTLAFLTVAWFWLLLPTQNPWYWTWAMPLLPFARSRVWLLLSGLTLIYYLRFWCLYHSADQTLFGTPYAGIDFFDFVGSWIEFAPWLLLLAFGYVRFRYRSRAGQAVV